MTIRFSALAVASALALTASTVWAAEAQSRNPAAAAPAKPAQSAPAAKHPAPETFVGGNPMPEREKKLVSIFMDSVRRYEAARTAVQRGDIRTSEELQISKFMADSMFANDWVGVFRGVRPTVEGDQWFAVEIAPGVVLTTQQNRYADEGQQTLIHRYSPMIPVLNHLQVGDIVVFSATMLSMDVSNNDDMVLRPHLIVRFAKLRPIVTPADNSSDTSGADGADSTPRE